jgi:hypothetical protein
MEVNTVGGPGRELTRSLSMRRRVSSGSKTATGMVVAHFMSANIQPAL